MKKNKVKETKNKKQKVLKTIGIIVAILLVLYFVAKIFFLVTYIKPYTKELDIKVKDIGDIENKVVSDYYSFENFKFRNDFKNYEIVNENEYDEETKSKSIAFKNETDKNAVVVEIREDFITAGLELNAFENFYFNLTGWDLKNEKEVILKSVDELNKGYDIFDSFHKIFFTYMINSVMLNNGNVTTFTVDGLDGYVLETNSGEGTEIITDIVLLKDDKAYSVRFFNETLNNEEITDFVSTFVIE